MRRLKLRSMTGYARHASEHDGVGVEVEIKSVNGRGRDVKMRLPAGFDALEIPLRSLISEKAARGSIQIGIRTSHAASEGDYLVDWDFLLRLISEARARKIPGSMGDPELAGFLQVRGVVRAGSEAEGICLDEDLSKALLTAFADGLDAWNASREQEGAGLESALIALLDEMQAHHAAALKRAEAVPQLLQTRWQSRLEELSVDVSPDRLAQELALMLIKADVIEELERLCLHIAGARDLLAKGSPCGRQLDFLTQELMREANTLCSKSTDAELTSVGLGLKQCIDQFREQVQNVE
jgi:uncharacterized protein (TIGR00255 family)